MTVIPACKGCREERAALLPFSPLDLLNIVHDGRCDCYLIKPGRPRVGVMHVHPIDESNRPWKYSEVA